MNLVTQVPVSQHLVNQMRVYLKQMYEPELRQANL